MPIHNGDIVRLHYTGTLADGTVFDSSRAGSPLQFVAGSDTMIPGFERAILGHEAGQRFSIRIRPEDAYGEYIDDLVMEMTPDEFPPDIKPEIGMMLEITTDEGDMQVQIKDILPNSILLDANHPLAGKELIFDIEILNVISGKVR